MADFYTVTTSFVGTLGGHEVEYHEGEVVSADDPAVRKMPLHFAPLIVREHAGHRARSVEQATAAPGERRGRFGRKAEIAEPPAGHAITTAGFKGR